MTASKRAECPTLSLYVEEPIETAKDDSLGRAPLARSLAEKVLGRNVESCMVFGVSGPWGSGKTSFMNLVQEHLEARSREKKWWKKATWRDRRILILRFNPWSYQSIDQLIVAFFKELRSALELADMAGLSAALEKMALALSSLSVLQVAQPVGILSAAAMPIARLLRSMYRSRPLSRIRAEIDNYMARARIHLVVLIDDLDRAEPHCVTLMLQLIRLNADFPSTTYILAYDRERTARIISRLFNDNDEDGRDYLRKLIQVSFNLPVLEELRLRREVAFVIRPLFELFLDDEDLAARHNSLRNAGFYELFDNMRDSIRFANSVSITLPAIWEEVNPVDFVALEALRLKCPLLHEQLYRDRWLLLNEARSDMELMRRALNQEEPDREGHAKAFGVLLQLAPVRHQDAARAVLVELFPQLSRLEDEHRPWESPQETEWSLDRRVCSTDHFESYFLLTTRERVVSERELGEIIALARDTEREPLGVKLLELDSQGKGNDALRRLSIRAQNMSAPQIETTIGAFLDVSDDPEHWGHPERTPLRFRMIGLYLATLLSAVSEPAERATVAVRCIESGIGLCGAVSFTSSAEDIEFRGEPLLDADGRMAVTSAACTRIQTAAADGVILHSPCGASILYRWLEWDAGSVYAYVAKVASERQDFLDLLELIYERGGPYSEASGSTPYPPRKFAAVVRSFFAKKGAFQDFVASVEHLADASAAGIAHGSRDLTLKERELLDYLLQGVRALRDGGEDGGEADDA